MKKALPAMFIGLIALTLLDVLGSILSRQMNFSYLYLGPISFLIYVLAAFLVARRTDKKTAITYSGLLGLFDATVGWKLSILLQANTGYQKIEITTFIFITTLVFVTLSGAVLGLLGWWLSSKIYRTQ